MPGEWFYVRPFDTAFFGPPEAQSAGETHFARSLFPPPPRSFQGLVRTRLLQGAQPALDLSDKSARGRRAIEALVGKTEELPQGWQIDGPFPVSEEQTERLTPWFVTPLFLRRDKTGASQPLKARFLETSPEDHAIGAISSSRAGKDDQPSGVLGVPGFDDSGPLDEWITASNMLWALTGEGAWDPNGQASLPSMVAKEFRTGLALESKTRRAMDHMLYSCEDLRFNGRGGFVGRLTAQLPATLSADSLSQGTVAFGRGGRLATLAPADSLDQFDQAWSRLVRGDHIPAGLEEATRFWMVLLTPVRFDEAFSEAERPVQYPKLYGSPEEVRFLGAIPGKPLTLGGYSIAEHSALPNYRYIPAGSCWLFDLPNLSPERRAETLRLLNFSHCLGRRDEAAMGFGHVAVGIDKHSI